MWCGWAAGPVAAQAPPESLAVRWQAGLFEVELAVSPDSLRQSLPSGWIDAESFRLARGDTLLTRGVDYLLDPRLGRLRLLRSYPAGTRLFASYRAFPVPMRPEYRRHDARAAAAREVAGRFDPREAGPEAAEADSLPRRRWFEGDVAGDAARLDISGSKTFAVEVGSQRDLALKQSLDLSVNGRIGRDVQVRAILSDRNTPLQPEGTSTQLEDLDRILVEVESPTARMTLGDFELVLPPSEFLRFRRQLEGARGEVNPRGGNLFATGATSPGSYVTRSFLGTEGKQGPYILQARGSSSFGVIVAGSERVWLDGRALTRGENEGYIIDYSEGTLTFTPRFPITAYSEITVDYQFAAERYRRAVFGAGAGWGASAPGVSGSPGVSGAGNSWLRATLLSEGDDRGKPLVPLTAFQREALRAAGDSVTADLRSGIIFRGAGLGEYERVLVDTIAVPFFRFTGPGQGSYEIRFEDVGEGRGDYRADAVTHPDTVVYVYEGHRKGRFLPGEAVPLPALTRLLSVAAAPPLGSLVRLRAELGLSEHDANTFSGRDDGNNRGAAFLVENSVGPFAVGGARLSLGGRVRSVEERFRPLDRLDPAYFSKDWNVEASRLERGDLRRALEGAVEIQRVSLRTTVEDLDNRRDFRGVRTTTEATAAVAGLDLRARALRARTRDTLTGQNRPGRRETESLSAARRGALVSLSSAYTRERSTRGSGPARAGSLFREGSLRLGSGSRWERLQSSVEWTRRVRWDLAGTGQRKLDTGDTGEGELDWQGESGRLVSLGYTLRNLRPEGEGETQRSRQGRLRWIERAGEDLLVQEGRMELTTAERSDRSKEVRFIGPGQGHFDSLGVYQGIGDYEVFYRDLGDSARVNRVEFSLRSELDLSRRPGEEEAASGLAARFLRTARLVHYWTARLEYDRPASYLWPRLAPALLGNTLLPLSEVQMRADASAFPSARWFSPRLRLELRRTHRAIYTNSSETSRTVLSGARLRSRPSTRWTADQELEWERTREESRITGQGAGVDGWRSLRLRLDQSVSLREHLTAGLESSFRLRRRVGGEETARVYEATPFTVWSPQSRSRVELRTTRTWLAREGSRARLSRELERAGWSSRLLATVHLREELDLSVWLRDARPDRGRSTQDGRMELRATF